MAPKVIKFPELQEEKHSIATEFEKISGIPNIIGAIDGTYINIRAPAHKIRSTYVNRLDNVSLTLQAICDARKRFIDVFTGTPSRMHDARVFDTSFISKKLPQICLPQFYIIGDGAYPLMRVYPLRNGF